MKPIDDLLNTIAANHGVELPANAKMAPAPKAKRSKREDEEDDAQASQQGGEPEDAMTDAQGAAGMNDAGAIQLAQAETGAPDAATGSAANSPAGANPAGGVARGTDEGSDGAIPLWGLGALAVGGIALAAGGGDGGSAAPPTVPNSFTLTGSVVLGPVIAGHGLTVAAYRADGTLLVQGAVNADGSYTLTVTENYTGPVLVRVIDTNAGNDYFDEATDATKDMTSDLRAVTVIAGPGRYTVNLNAATELAVRELGLAGGNDGASIINLGAFTAADINNANTNVAAALGLTGTNIVTGTVVAVIDAMGAANPAANDYGRVLAAISGMEEGAGSSTDQVLNDLARQITGNTLDDAGKNDLIAGLANVESQAEVVATLAESLGLEAGAATAAENAWQVILAAADGTDNNTTNPTQAQYTAIGVTGVDTAAEQNLLGDVIDIKGNADVDTVAEVQALADIVGKLMLHAAGTPQTISQTELEALGLTDLNSDRVADLLGKVAASADDGSGIDTLAELQAMVDTVAPTVVITSNVSAVKAGETATITFTLSEASTDFTVDDITVAGGALSGFTVTANPLVYTATFTPTASLATGTASITVASASYTDAAGNTGAAGTTPAISIDTLPPTITSGATATAILENSGADQVIYTATSTDSADTATGSTVYSLKAGSDTGLTINASTGAVSLTANPDFESKPSYSFTVVATDAASNAAEQAVTLAITDVDEVPPTITSVAITSATGIAASTLNAGDVVSVTVTMSEATIVTGTPTLALNIGGTTVQANYASGSGTTALVFNYTIQAGQTDVDGISIAANSLALNSGTLKDAAGNNATLSHSAVTDNAGYLVDTTAPVFTTTQTSMTQLEAINQTTGGNYDPQIAAVGSDGEFVVTWHGTDSARDNSIFVQKFNAYGSIGSNTPVQLEATGNTTGSDYAPQIAAVGSDGAFVVTWYGVDSAGDYSIFVQKFNADGTIGINAPVQLEAISKTNGNDLYPQISALGSAGEFVVTWQGQDSSSPTDNSIFVQKFNADGTTTNNAPVQLEAIGNMTGSDQYPQIAALGSSGAFVVTWYGLDSAGDNSIFVQKFDADGTIGSNTPVQLEAISKPDGADLYPQIAALGSSGAFVVTWYGQDIEGDNSIFVQKFNADGTIGSNTPVQLEAIGNTTGRDYSPQIAAVGSDGEFVVTWYGQKSAGDYSIFVQKFDANGAPSGSPVMLEATGVTNGANESPQIAAVGSGGEYVVTWHGSDSAGDYSIFVQKFNANGTITGNTPVMLEATGVTDGGDYIPQITAVGSDGEFVVTWYGQNSARDFSIFLQKFNADGTVVAASIDTASVAENTATSTTVYDATADGDVGVSYSLSGTDSALFNINASTGAVTFKLSPDYENPADAGGNNVYDFTVTATDAAGNTAGQAVALTVNNIGEAGEAVIDLGSYGKLIAPVQVEGKWYYYWDRSGNGASGVDDQTTHDVLDGIFKYDSAGNLNPAAGTDTTDSYRYATINGVQLALPTANGGMAYPAGINGYENGTAATGTGTSNNSSFDELLAIWDTHNGTSTAKSIVPDSPVSGKPTGWSDYYWSATPSLSGHAGVDLAWGNTFDNADTLNNWVALQVL